MRKYTKTIKKSSNRSAKSLNQKNKRNFVRYKILRKQQEYGINGGKAHRVQESILENLWNWAGCSRTIIFSDQHRMDWLSAGNTRIAESDQ